MGTNSQAPDGPSEQPAEYRVRWGNVVLAALALAGIVAAFALPTGGPSPAVTVATEPFTPKSETTGPTAVADKSEAKPRRKRRRKRTHASPPRIEPRSAPTSPAPPPTPPAQTGGGSPSDPVADEFGF